MCCDNSLLLFERVCCKCSNADDQASDRAVCAHPKCLMSKDALSALQIDNCIGCLCRDCEVKSMSSFG